MELVFNVLLLSLFFICTIFFLGSILAFIREAKRNKPKKFIHTPPRDYKNSFEEDMLEYYKEKR